MEGQDSSPSLQTLTLALFPESLASYKSCFALRVRKASCTGALSSRHPWALLHPIHSLLGRLGVAFPFLKDLHAQIPPVSGAGSGEIKEGFSEGEPGSVGEVHSG